MRIPFTKIFSLCLFFSSIAPAEDEPLFRIEEQGKVGFIDSGERQFRIRGSKAPQQYAGFLKGALAVLCG